MNSIQSEDARVLTAACVVPSQCLPT